MVTSLFFSLARDRMDSGGGDNVKDFNDFLEFLSDNHDTVLFDTMNNIKDVSESQRTISREEWIFIDKYVFKSTIAILRQYHKWLNQTPTP